LGIFFAKPLIFMQKSITNCVKTFTVDKDVLSGYREHLKCARALVIVDCRSTIICWVFGCIVLVSLGPNRVLAESNRIARQL
jgi:hypothetical protein